MCIFNASTRKVLSLKTLKTKSLSSICKYASVCNSQYSSPPILQDTLCPNVCSAKPKKEEGREGGRDRRKNLSLEGLWQEKKGRKAKSIL